MSFFRKRNQRLPNSKTGKGIFDLLSSKLEMTTDHFELPVYIIRLRPGYLQRGDGAWSWLLEDARGQEICGSMDTAKDCLKSLKEDSCNVYHSGAGSELFAFDIKKESDQ